MAEVAKISTYTSLVPRLSPASVQQMTFESVVKIKKGRAWYAKSRDPKLRNFRAILLPRCIAVWPVHRFYLCVGNALYSSSDLKRAGKLIRVMLVHYWPLEPWNLGVRSLHHDERCPARFAFQLACSKPYLAALYCYLYVYTSITAHIINC